MPGMMRRQRAVGGCLRAFRGEVVMQFDHRDTARHGLRSIDLDLVIVLRANRNGCQSKRRTGEQESGYCLAFQ
jgi:hypothetical protein